MGFASHRAVVATVLCIAAALPSDAGAASGAVHTGAGAQACQAERFRYIYPLSDIEFVVDRRVSLGLPTDPATRDRAGSQTERRGFDETFEAGVTLTDEENAAFWRFRDYTERIQPVRDYFAANPENVAYVSWNRDRLDPVFALQTVDGVTDAQLVEINRLAPDDIPTVHETVEWSRAQIDAALRDIDAERAGESSTLRIYERIRSVGLEPHNGLINDFQFLWIEVDPSDIGCDAQLTALVADAVADLDIPPIVIVQAGRLRED